MKYLPQVFYDAEFDTTTVSGTSPSLNPFSVDIVGGNAHVWSVILSRTRYRKLTFLTQRRVSRPMIEENDDAET